MNFIRHFKSCMSQFAKDDRLKPQHISLYFALFHNWNMNHFRNPVPIYRSEIMHLSRIGSVATYIRCIKDLSEWNYIRYEPSFNPLEGSRVHLYSFDKGKETGDSKGDEISSDSSTITEPEQSTDPARGQATDHARDTIYINNTNSTNKTNYTNAYGTSNENSNFVNGGEADAQSPSTRPRSHHQQKQTPGGRAGSERLGAIPSSLEEAQTYFLEIQSTTAEAEKFYNHFQSNGWKVGGRSAMKDWRAAARNWMINAKKFTYEPTSQPKPGKLNTGPKNYAEPL